MEWWGYSKEHGWVVLDIGADVPEDLWDQLEEWIYTSYTLVAPKRLARIVLDADTRGGQQLDS